MSREITRPASETCDYLSLEKNDAAREIFDASVARHMNAFPCDLDNASASLARLTKYVSAAARETLPVKRPKPPRKREVSHRTKMLFEERRRNFNKLSELLGQSPYPAETTSDTTCTKF